jgi:hypothetical protein
MKGQKCREDAGPPTKKGSVAMQRRLPSLSAFQFAFQQARAVVVMQRFTRFAWSKRLQLRKAAIK